jgi:uncharacterized membrane protein
MSDRSRARRVYGLFFRALIGVFVLVIFVGLGLLVYVGRLDGEALILLSGVIIGYLARMGTEVL